MLLKFDTSQSQGLYPCLLQTDWLLQADFSHLSIHTTDLGELDKQFRRDLEEWPRIEAWMLRIKAVLINTVYQEKNWSLFWLFEKPCVGDGGILSRTAKH